MLVLIRPAESLTTFELGRVLDGLSRLTDQVPDIRQTISCSQGGMKVTLPDDGAHDHQTIGRVVVLLIGALIGRLFDYTLTCECCPEPTDSTGQGMAALSVNL